MVFKNLKKQDWISAGIRGLSSGLTIWAATGLGGGDDAGGGNNKPTEGTQTQYQPIGDMEFLPDGAAPIFGMSEGWDSGSIDFGSGVMSNIMSGPNQTAQINSPMNMERLGFDSSILGNFDLNEVISDWTSVFDGPLGGVVQQFADKGVDVNALIPNVLSKMDNPATGLIQQILPFAQQGVIDNLVENEAIPPNAYQVGDTIP